MNKKNLNDFKNNILKMMDTDYESFVKAIIVIENGSITKSELDKSYNEYMKNDIPLLNPYFLENELNISEKTIENKKLER